MTISERALNAAWERNKIFPDAQIGTFEDGYIRGAIEQRKIDIEKACEWFSEHIIDYVYYDEINGCSINYTEMHKDFRKTMEE